MMRMIFMKVSGVVIDVSVSAKAFGDNRDLYISYDYFVNDSVYYSGYTSNAQLSRLNRGLGGAVILKVHKKNPKISFFWKEGFLPSLSKKRALLLQQHIEKVYRLKMKKKHTYLKKNNLEYNSYYLHDSIQ